jgi:CTP:molybdopterin cytidylyltransferase MocA
LVTELLDDHPLAGGGRVSFPCLILAAGFGTRMGALTRDRPKALIEVAGRPLIAHALDAARAAGAVPIAVNGHYRARCWARGWPSTRRTFISCTKRPRSWTAAAR